MALPITLPAPPVTVQDPSRCWAAAYESWDAANQAQFGVPAQSAPTEFLDRVGRRIGSLTRTGAITDPGLNLYGGLALMRTRWLRGRRVNTSLLGDCLEEGYVFCMYYTARTGQSGHAVVIYGVERGAIRVMDPRADHGLKTVPATFFMDKVDVFLGTPLLVGLSRSVAASLAGLTGR